MDKFVIYYEPLPGETKEGTVKSFSINFSRMDKKTDTYKLKVIKEIYKKDGKTCEKVKIREFHRGLRTILNKINLINFEKGEVKTEDLENIDGIILIKQGDKCIESNSLKELEKELNIFNFFDIYNLDTRLYDKIKDVYEFIEIDKIFNKKLNHVRNKNKFSNGYFDNPYDCFEYIYEM